MLRLDPFDVNFVIYHHPCPDGLMSALLIDEFNRINNPNNVITYFGTSHGKSPPDVHGKNVIIADFSYSEEIIKQMINQANNLLIIDHHKSAEICLQNIDDKYKIFDMNHSGAGLVWRYLYGDLEPLLFVQYVEAYDIWKFDRLENVKACNSWYSKMKFDFDTFRPYLDNNLFLEKLNNSIIAYEFDCKKIEDITNRGCPVFCEFNKEYYFVAYVNSCDYKSDVGNALLSKFPHVDFSVVYSSNNYRNNTTFSLRSSDDRTDVSQIATLIGGGGHRNASGAEISYITNVLPKSYYNIYNLYKCFDTMYNEIHYINGNNYAIVLLNSMTHCMKLAKYLIKKYNNLFDIAIVWYKKQNQYFYRRCFNKSVNENNYNIIDEYISHMKF